MVYSIKSWIKSLAFWTLIYMKFFCSAIRSRLCSLLHRLYLRYWCAHQSSLINLVSSLQNGHLTSLSLLSWTYFLSLSSPLVIGRPAVSNPDYCNPWRLYSNLKVTIYQFLTILTTTCCMSRWKNKKIVVTSKVNLYYSGILTRYSIGSLDIME